MQETLTNNQHSTNNFGSAHFLTENIYFHSHKTRYLKGQLYRAFPCQNNFVLSNLGKLLLIGFKDRWVYRQQNIFRLWFNQTANFNQLTVMTRWQNYLA